MIWVGGKLTTWGWSPSIGLFVLQVKQKIIIQPGNWTSSSAIRHLIVIWYELWGVRCEVWGVRCEVWWYEACGLRYEERMYEVWGCEDTRYKDTRKKMWGIRTRCYGRIWGYEVCDCLSMWVVWYMLGLSDIIFTLLQSCLGKTCGRQCCCYSILVRWLHWTVTVHSLFSGRSTSLDWQLQQLSNISPPRQQTEREARADLNIIYFLPAVWGLTNKTYQHCNNCTWQCALRHITLQVIQLITT